MVRCSTGQWRHVYTVGRIHRTDGAPSWAGTVIAVRDDGIVIGIGIGIGIGIDIDIDIGIGIKPICCP